MRKRALLTCAALLSLAVTSPAADYSSTVSSFNPAGYWRLNETAPIPVLDVATNSGTLGLDAFGYYVSGSIHPVAGALVGSTDAAASFPDASGNRIRVPFLPALAVRGPFTVEFWAKPAALASGDNAFMCPVSFTQFGEPPGTGSFRSGWLFYQTGAAGWSFRIYAPDSTLYNAASTAANTAGQWYHVVGVYDGANVTLYVNGAQAATAAAPKGIGPVSNQTIVMSIGARADGQLGFFRYNGDIDEVAYYPSALSAAEILAHYQNGTSATPATPYQQLILANNPLAYYRFNEPVYVPETTFPVADNSGTLGTVANGTTSAGLYSGFAGPPYSGLPAGNLAYAFSGQGGAIDCGTAEDFNTTGSLTVMAWIKAKNFDRTWQSIVTKGDSAWRVHRNGNTPNLGFGTSGLSNVDQSGSRVLNDGQWHHIAAVYNGTGSKSIYVDGLLDNSVAATGTLAQNTYPVFIGANAEVTDRFFSGTIDEVAFFTNALTLAQIQQIYYSANVSPIIAQQPQAPFGTIIAGAPVTLSVLAVGNPTLMYQWTKEGVELSGQTTSVLSFANISTNDAGNYTVVVTNSFGSVTSSVVNLVVTYPTAPATLANAFAYPVYNPANQSATLTEVTLEFTGPLASEGGNASHYSIPGLTVTAARFTNLNTTVVLTTTPQTQGALYTVTVTGVSDGVGNPLANNTAQFRAWVANSLSGLHFEYYPAEATASPYFGGAVLGALLNNPLYPDYPVLRTNVHAFDSRVVFPTDAVEQYGARMRGVFVPSMTAKYRFYIRSDDASILYFNPNGPDPAGKQMILEETGCCGDWNKFESAAYQLVGGQPYYIEYLYKEGGGGDYGKVAARLDGTGSPPVGVANTQLDPSSIIGPAIAYPYAPADAAGTLGIEGPSSISVQANHVTNFTAVVSNPGGWPLSYQWLQGSTEIPGATSSSYTFVPTAADNGKLFRVRVSRLGSTVLSSQATLTVTPDTDAPAVALVRGSPTLNTIVVSFQETVASPAPGSFTIPGFTTTSAVVDATGTNVIVTFDPPLTPGQAYNLSVQNVVDATGNNLSSAAVTVRSFVFSRGLLKFDFFGGLSQSDNNIYATLLTDPRFPNSPDFTGFLTAFDSRTIFPDDAVRGYGDFISGLFVPPESGNYIFYLRSDDTSLLFLNALGADPIGVPLPVPALLEETSCCHPFSNLASTPQTLVANTMYAIAAVHKEGGGGDFVQAAAKLETDPIDPNALAPLRSSIGVLADPVGASLTITKQPANAMGVYVGAQLNTDFNANDGGFSVVNYGGPPGPWNYSAAGGSWTNFGPTDCGGPFATGLRSPVLTIRSNTPVVLTFAHRYSYEFDTSTDWDGAQVRLSVNGGPFGSVPGSSFTANGYVGPIEGTVFAGITATAGWVNEAFIRESTGYTTRTFITSVATLGTFNPGDTVQVEFLSSWDECSELGGPPDWEIDRVQVDGGGAVLPAQVTLTVAAESTYLGRPNEYISYFWQRDTGSGFTDIPGASTPSYILYPGLSDSGTRYRCALYSPGASATSEVATVTVTLPLYVSQTAPDTLTLSWPKPTPPLPATTTFLLEKSPTLQPGAWVEVPSSGYQTTAETVHTTVTISTTGPTQFYRLRRN